MTVLIIVCICAGCSMFFDVLWPIAFFAFAVAVVVTGCFYLYQTMGIEPATNEFASFVSGISADDDFIGNCGSGPVYLLGVFAMFALLILLMVVYVCLPVGMILMIAGACAGLFIWLFAMLFSREPETLLGLEEEPEAAGPEAVLGGLMPGLLVFLVGVGAVTAYALIVRVLHALTAC